MTREEAIEILWRYDVNFEPHPPEEVMHAIDMAIEALQVEAGQEAVPTVVRVTMSDGSQYYLEHERDAIQADAVQGWIPCSERLPKRDELVLVTYKTTDRIHLCRYMDDGSENPWWSYIDDCCAWNNVVLAWMPLPKPYKGGDTE